MKIIDLFKSTLVGKEIYMYHIHTWADIKTKIHPRHPRDFFLPSVGMGGFGAIEGSITDRIKVKIVDVELTEITADEAETIVLVFDNPLVRDNGKTIERMEIYSLDYEIELV